MEAFPVFDEIKIKSSKGIYNVIFSSSTDQIEEYINKNSIFIIDENISKIYNSKLKSILSKKKNILIIKSTEKNKSLEKFPKYIENLVNLKIRRGQNLVALGGGVIQDITCFLAATMMRGIPWIFFPTTLLAQSDSCIGSKSSINCGKIKNILGTFTPPEKIIIDTNFLQTLTKKDIHSGLGEMIKVHAINSPSSFDKISSNYEKIFNNPFYMKKFIYKSLLIKKKLIELDEFDQGPRNVMNYGHSFGHAIETATNYAIPHGIAITIGMDIANFLSAELGISKFNDFERMHLILHKNSKLCHNIYISDKLMIGALLNDKKNTKDQLKLVLPDKNYNIKVNQYDNNYKFRKIIKKYFNLYR